MIEEGRISADSSRYFIKAKPTELNGITYRSRLEAKWAYLFTNLGLHFNYEPAAFRLREDLIYLPDFYFPSLLAFIEIKPDMLLPRIEYAKILEFGKKIQVGRVKYYVILGSPVDRFKTRTVEEIEGRWKMGWTSLSKILSPFHRKKLKIVINKLRTVHWDD